MKTIATFLIAICCCYASKAADASSTTSPTSAPPAESSNSSEKDFEKQMLGVWLVADRSLNHIDHFRTLGMQNGFGQNEPLCDFIATEKWVSKYGPSIKAGEKIKIGKITLVEATDGFGNTGTKLILNSAEPKEGLVFYCYAFNRAEKAYWAIDKEKIRKALKGYFRIEEENQGKQAAPKPQDKEN